MKEKRRHWFEHLLDLDPDKLVFVDETAVTTAMARRHGRRRRGKRLRASVPHGHRKTLTTVAALRSGAFLAQQTINGAMNTERFEAWIRNALVPTLRPGDVVAMDNVRFHKAEDVRKLIENCGASLDFLPPYSPDMNPIEKAFSKLKAYLRKLAARTVNALLDALRTSHTHFTPSDCLNYFIACGYQFSQADP